MTMRYVVEIKITDNVEQKTENCVYEFDRINCRMHRDLSPEYSTHGAQWGRPISWIDKGSIFEFIGLKNGDLGVHNTDRICLVNTDMQLEEIGRLQESIRALKAELNTYKEFEKTFKRISNISIGEMTSILEDFVKKE